MSLSHGSAPAPAVSVVIPTYNRADLLGRALDSVLGQTFADYEVLVIDDGSTDGTAAAAARYAERDRRVQYLRQPENRGVSAARNRGLCEARGEFVAFLDSDDEWMPDKLERQLAVMAAASDRVGLVYTGVESVFGDGSRRVDRASRRGDVYAEMLAGNVLHGGGSNVLLRRAAAERTGFFDEGIPAAEDYDYWLRVTRHFEVDLVADPLVRYHDPRGVERRSLDAARNLAARAWLYRTHGAEMRRAGRAHLYLIDSARRHRRVGDRAGARRAALRAVLAQPGAAGPYRELVRAVMPRRFYDALAGARARVRSRRSAPGGGAGGGAC